MNTPRNTQPVIDIYARVSKSTTITIGRSTDRQIEDGIADITSRGAVVGMVHRDESLSAWRQGVVRPEWNILMERLRTGEANGVWVWELTRFTRKMRDGLDLLDLADKGSLVWSDDQTWNMTKAAGRKAFRDAINAAETESETISERTSKGKWQKAKKGRSNASHRGYARPGYLPNPKDWMPGDPRTLVPDEQLAAEREVVREMATRLLSGHTMDSVVRDVNARGITTITGGRWTAVSIKQMLLAPSMAGLIEYNGEVIKGKVLDGEPPLDRETWDALGSLFAGRKRGRPASTYLLSGIARCGRCGAPLYGRPRVSRNPYADGEVAREYWCQPKSGHGVGCGRLNIDQRFADGVVKATVIEVLSDPRRAERINRQREATNAAMVKVLATIKRLDETGLGVASKAAERGDAWVEAAMGPIDKALAKARAELAALEDGSDDAHVGNAADDWAQAETSGNIGALRAMIRRAFPNLTIRPATSRGLGARTEVRFDWDGETLAALSA
jgi:site-specific DNA recombinase